MLEILANIGVLIIALLHAWFCILEVYFWKKPLGLKTFRMQEAFARESAALAANQGVYNAFLSAGLIWALCTTDPAQSLHIKTFFLSCVVIAGIAGSITVSKRILLIQGLPAAITLVLLYL